ACSVKYFLLDRTIHRHSLHSFPTRRSSDLPESIILIANAISKAMSRRFSTSSACLLTRRSIGCELQLTQLGDKLPSSYQKIRRSDRKSTRLNSSHQIISYAVFCLKTKNNQK